MTPITGTEGGQGPFFSPDGAWIGFVTGDALKKVPAAGGAAQIVVSQGQLDAADWGRNGMIYFTPRAGGTDGVTALARVPETGGNAEVVAQLDTTAGEYGAWLPEILPDARTVLITIASRQGFSIVAVRPDGTRHSVVRNALLARYVPSGYLLYFDFDPSATLAAPFDPVAAKITGPAVPITESVDVNYAFDVGADGTLVYVPTSAEGQGLEVAWIGSDGRSTPVMNTRGRWTQPRIAPDGHRILMRKVGNACELWMYDLDRAVLTRVAASGDLHSPVWSPDGSRIAFRREDGEGSLHVMRLGGARQDRTVLDGRASGEPWSWSAGGNLLAFTKGGRGTARDIYVLPMDRGASPIPFLVTPNSEKHPSIHPSGHWIAYDSNETGMSEVFIRRYPDTGDVWQVSTGGGAAPLWSRDGRSLYFQRGRDLLRVETRTAPSLTIGEPQRVAKGISAGVIGRAYDVGADGRVVSVRAPGDVARLPAIRVLLHWEQELARLQAPGH